MTERSLSDLADELEASLEGLFVVTQKTFHQWDFAQSVYLKNLDKIWNRFINE